MDRVDKVIWAITVAIVGGVVRYCGRRFLKHTGLGRVQRSL